MPLSLPSKPIEPFNVLGFDPGGTTGWAQAVCFVPNPELEDIHLWTGELGPGAHHEELYDFICKEGRNTSAGSWEVVFEPFHYRQNVVEEGEKFRGKVELISSQYIGIITLACRQLGLRYYDRFTPGEAKSYVTNQKLEKLGWLQTPQHPMRHRNDALRQVVKYLIVKHRIQHPLTTAWRQ